MWSNLLLFVLLAVCIVTDIRKRKIYNAVLFPVLAAAFIMNTCFSGLPGLEDSLLGGVAGFGILLLPYLLGGMGAGDVKLLAVIGAIKGIVFVLMAAFYMAIAGGIIALFVLLFKKGIRKRLNQIVYCFHGMQNGISFSPFSDKEGLRTTYPYGLAIAAGAIIQALQAGGFLK